MNADFSISATPGTQTSGGGGSTAFNVSIGAIGGFAGNVALSVRRLPAGATPSFAPSSVVGSGTSILTIATTTSTPAANSTVIITGTSGGLIHTTSVALVTINADQIVGQMSLDQMTRELHGIQDASDYRVVPGISSLGIPLLNITNGPAGATNGGPGHQERSRLNFVGIDAVPCAMEARDALHADGGSAGALDFGAHGDEAVGQVHHLGFAGAIFQH